MKGRKIDEAHFKTKMRLICGRVWVFRGVFEGMWRRGGGSALGVEGGLG